MPGSLPNPIVYFPAKVVVYSLAGWVLNKIYREGVNPLIFGVLRVAVGFGLGFLLVIAISALFPGPDSSGYSDYVLLGSTRLIVWTGMIWFLYERENLSPLRFFILVISGILLSFGIDAAFSWLDKEFPGMLSVAMC